MRRLIWLSAALAIVLLIAWAIRPGAPATTAGLGVAFVGLTNEPSGTMFARFALTNAGMRGVHLGVNEVQILETNGWPNWTRNPGGSNWFSIAARSRLVVSVPCPDDRAATWRVPITYSEDQTFGEAISDKTKALMGYALGRLSTRPFPRLGPRRWSLLYGPEMLGLTNRLPEPERPGAASQ